MKRLWLFPCLALSLSSATGEERSALEDDLLLPDYSQVYDPLRNPFEDGKKALRYARETNRRVLIEPGGAWCSHCQRLDHFIRNNPAVRNALYRNFVVLKINISDENDNGAFMAGLPRIYGYPHFFVAESDGTIIHSQDTARFLHHGEYSQERFLEFIDRWGLTRRSN